MANCTSNTLQFPSCKSKKVELNFKGGHVTSDGGVLLLRQVDQRIGLTTAVAKAFNDEREPSKIQHSIQDLIRQRVYGIALGYEDLNDHDQLRMDKAIQTAVNRDTPLASASTLCRLENAANRQLAVDINKCIVEQFIASFKKSPKELILDFDATNDLVHGNQVGKFFHGYYDSYCFLPLHVFCGEQTLISYLRPSNQDGAKHAWAILSLLVKRFRQVWPNVQIIFRADSGFCRQKMLN
jgi:hypothetical protein